LHPQPFLFCCIPNLSLCYFSGSCFYGHTLLSRLRSYRDLTLLSRSRSYIHLFNC
jgi:hypothetical protein